MTAFLLHHLVSESAARAPGAPAVRHGGDQLSYADLDAQSCAVAHALAELGVRRGDRVALYAPKSLGAVTALYGILKAGATYVPIDAASPAPRLAAIVDQCRPRCIVTTADRRDRVDAQLLARAGVTAILSVDDAEPFADLPVARLALADALATFPASDPAVPAVDHDLAYVLFTSGSTGTPKGVMLSHLNALTFVRWAVDTFDIASSDRLSNHAPFTFDLSVLDLYAAAQAGACVTLIPEASAMFPTRLAELVERERLTVWYSVPSVLTLLLTRGALAERRLDSLRWVLFAGEVFPTKYLRRLMQALPHARFANLYGPTETNVITWYEVPPLPEDRTEPIPIGQACRNTDCIVLASTGEVVARPGEEGLLYARGSTVMQGYYGRPEESAQAFVPNPLAAGRDERLYCTGDWVTLDGDGNFLYLGRRDHMVKTGGYRVELGEIETALYAHPVVREAAAIPVPDDVLGNRIVAVVVADGLTEAELRQHCAARLPRYMVPERIEFRDALPRTATDKVDRSALASLMAVVGGVE